MTKTLEVYKRGDIGVIGSGYIIPREHPLSWKKGMSMTDMEKSFVREADVDAWKNTNRFVGLELVVDYWHLKYMHMDALLNAQEWETQLAEYAGPRSRGYSDALSKLIYWHEIARIYGEQLDILYRFAYTGSYDKD